MEIWIAYLMKYTGAMFTLENNSPCKLVILFPISFKSIHLEDLQSKKLRTINFLDQVSNISQFRTWNVFAKDHQDKKT